MQRWVINPKKSSALLKEVIFSKFNSKLFHLNLVWITILRCVADIPTAFIKNENIKMAVL